MRPNHILSIFSKDKCESKSEIQPPPPKPPRSEKPLLIAAGFSLALVGLLTCQSFKANFKVPPFEGGVEWNKK